MRAADFDYDLPAELIAQQPAATRDQSRLLVVQRHGLTVAHRRFPDLLEYLRAGDVLVLNDSKVIPARLRGKNHETGGEFEILLLEENTTNDWWAMMRPGKRARIGTRIDVITHGGAPTNLHATVTAMNAEGHRRLQFEGAANLRDHLDVLGEMPLPPYIKRASHAELAGDLARYQTVYAKPAGSVAAPTAGLHFTPALLEKIRNLGAQICAVTLHVGLGTFASVKTDTLSEHVMHEERYEVNAASAQLISEAKAQDRRVIAVGTTSLRVLESVAAANEGRIVDGSGRTRLFVHPPYRFHVVDALLTNFHLPRSTLLMLVSAFAAPGELHGREAILRAYAEAVRERYRFFSYGDAMLIL